jgi:hypothetical protein
MLAPGTVLAILVEKYTPAASCQHIDNLLSQSGSERRLELTKASRLEHLKTETKILKAWLRPRKILTSGFSATGMIPCQSNDLVRY